MSKKAGDQEVFTLCLPEEFIAKSNNIIIGAFELGYHSIYQIYAIHAEIEHKAQNYPLANALCLGAAICAMEINFESVNEPFRLTIPPPRESSEIINDYTTEQLEFIECVYTHINEPLVSIRFVDLLWVYSRPRKISHAKAIIETCLHLPINQNTWKKGYGDCWERAICIAKQTKNEGSIQLIEKALLGTFKKNHHKDGLISLSLAKLIHKKHLCVEEQPFVATSLLKRIKLLASSGILAKEPPAKLDLLRRMLNEQNRQEELAEAQIIYADCLVKDGDNKCSGKYQDYIRANSCYNDAFSIYQKIPQAYKEKFDVYTKRKETKEKIKKSGIQSLEQMKVIYVEGEDFSVVRAKTCAHVSGKENIQLALLYFSGIDTFNFQEHYKTADHLIQEFPIRALAGRAYLSSDGRTVAKSPPYNSKNEKDNAVYEQAIELFSWRVNFLVKEQILPALEQILSEHRVTKNFLEFLCGQSPLVPDDRIKLMASALYCGFEYDFSNGIHLLSPQVENIVRVIFKNNKINTSHIDQSIETENCLSSLLKDDKAQDVLGEDLFFELKAVFIEPIGLNLRHDVAHGLLNDDSSNSCASVYAWWLILKLIIGSYKEMFPVKD